MTDLTQVTRLGAAKLRSGADQLTDNDITSYRAVSVQKSTAERLGPLKDLPGFWQGTGFSLIARPDFSGGSENGIYLELNLLRETLEFTTIGSPVFNRGSRQSDIAIYGLTYIHRVTDGVTGGALHIEPGLWLNIPGTTEPKAEASIARLATIPHGNAVCTTGFVQEVELDGLPTIPPANTTPFPIGGQPPEPGTPNPLQEFNLGIPSSFRSTPLPGAITQAMVDDPNTVLRTALAGQTLTNIKRLITTTASPAAVGNIPFITANADAPSLDSVFAIETVTQDDGTEFLQLQYSQTVLLNFRGMSYPHVTVGTLIKAF